MIFKSLAGTESGKADLVIYQFRTHTFLYVMKFECKILMVCMPRLKLFSLSSDSKEHDFIKREL
jgi:hypothetical protein